MTPSPELPSPQRSIICGEADSIPVSQAVLVYYQSSGCSLATFTLYRVMNRLRMSPMEEFLVNAGCRDYSSQLFPVPLLLSISLLTSIFAVISINKLPAWQQINVSLTLTPLNLYCIACFVLAGDRCVLASSDRNFNHYSCACCEMQLSSCWISSVVHWVIEEILIYWLCFHKYSMISLIAQLIYKSRGTEEFCFMCTCSEQPNTSSRLSS